MRKVFAQILKLLIFPIAYAMGLFLYLQGGNMQYFIMGFVIGFSVIAVTDKKVLRKESDK